MPSFPPHFFACPQGPGGKSPCYSQSPVARKRGAKAPSWLAFHDNATLDSSSLLASAFPVPSVNGPPTLPSINVRWFPQTQHQYPVM